MNYEETSTTTLIKDLKELIKKLEKDYECSLYEKQNTTTYHPEHIIDEKTETYKLRFHIHKKRRG